MLRRQQGTNKMLQEMHGEDDVSESLLKERKLFYENFKIPDAAESQC